MTLLGMLLITLHWVRNTLIRRAQRALPLQRDVPESPGGPLSQQTMISRQATRFPLNTPSWKMSAARPTASSTLQSPARRTTHYLTARMQVERFFPASNARPKSAMTLSRNAITLSRRRSIPSVITAYNLPSSCRLGFSTRHQSRSSHAQSSLDTNRTIMTCSLVPPLTLAVMSGRSWLHLFSPLGISLTRPRCQPLSRCP